MADPNDPIHQRCDFLIPQSSIEGLDITAVNQWVRSEEFWAPWPDFLIVFASNGCGDYFAYDTRQSPATVVYIAPEGTPEEELNAEDALRYDNFDQWYERKIAEEE